MSAMYPSTGYIGIPLLLIAYGDDAIVPAIIGAAITGALFLPIATAAGLGISAIGFQLPAAATTFFDILGGAFSPSALFAVGLFIGTRRLQAAAVEVSWVIFVKLIAQPVITAWLAYYVFGLSGLWAAAAVIHAALPTGVPVFVVAQRYKTYVERSSAVVVVSTGLSILTLSVLLVVLGIE